MFVLFNELVEVLHNDLIDVICEPVYKQNAYTKGVDKRTVKKISTIAQKDRTH